MKHILKKLKITRGTTLVEMMIAFTLFGILITITVSNFKQSLEFQQLSTLLLESHDGVGLLFEQISREVRTSKKGSLQASPNYLKFNNQKNEVLEYNLGPDGVIMRTVGNAAPQDVTVRSSRIRIKSFSPQRINGGTLYERLVMSVETAVTDKRGNEYSSVIQTTVSQRFYE